MTERKPFNQITNIAVGDRAFPVAANSLPPTCNVCTLYGLSYSGVPPHEFHRNICSACAVTVVIFGHLNRSFYLGLLTYLVIIIERVALRPLRLLSM